MAHPDARLPILADMNSVLLPLGKRFFRIGAHAGRLNFLTEPNEIVCGRRLRRDSRFQVVDLARAAKPVNADERQGRRRRGTPDMASLEGKLFDEDPRRDHRRIANAGVRRVRELSD